MSLNSNNQFENFIKGAPLTHSSSSPKPLTHVTPYSYKDDTPVIGGLKNVGAYAGERLCWKQSSNYTSLETPDRHSKLFFVLTEEILNSPDAFKSTQIDTPQNTTFHPGTVLGLTFAGRDSLRYISTINPQVDKFI